MKFTGEQFLFGGSSNRIKADAVVKYLFASFFVKDKVILDIACGSGFGTFFYAQNAREVWGIDKSAAAINYAKTNYRRPNIKFFQNDIFDFNFPFNFFDVIISLHTLEQLDKPEKFLKFLKNSLKDEGSIILATPNKKIVSPFTKEPIGKFNKFEFYKKDLEELFKEGDLKVGGWYGQRCVFKPLSWWFFRRLIRVIEVLFNKKFGFFGRRESYQIKPLKFWQEPMYFIIILTKKNEV